MVLVFKTSVKSQQDVDHLAPALDCFLHQCSWNFDLDDCDNIFRIEGHSVSASQIITFFQKSGFDCQELE